MKNTLKRLFKQDLNQEITVPQRHKPLLRSLEPRIVLDAAAVETGLDMANLAVSEQQAQDYIAGENHSTVSDDALELEAVGPINGQLPTMRRDEIVFIDPDFNDLPNLLAKIEPAVEVIVLDRDSDGFEQITEALEGWDEVSAVHIFAGGEDGSRNLGSLQLSEEMINGELINELVAVGALNAETSELLVYSADFEFDTPSSTTIDAEDALISGEAVNHGNNENIDHLSGDGSKMIEAMEDEIRISSVINEIQDLSRVDALFESQSSKVTGSLHELFANKGFGAGSAWQSFDRNDYLTESHSFVGDQMMVVLGDFEIDDDPLKLDGEAPLSYDALQAKAFLEGLEDRQDMLQLYLNSYVRHNTLYVTIDSNDKYFDDMQVERYSATLADGAPLPEWIKLDANGFLSLKQLDDVDVVELNIVAVLENGTEISKSVSVETNDGSLTRLSKVPNEVIYTQDFGDRI